MVDRWWTDGGQGENMNIIDVLEELKIFPRKKSAKEYCSPCPYCNDGTDRFTIWPDQGKGGQFWCRVCEKKGDAIKLLRDLQGLTYRQACVKLRVDPVTRHTSTQEQKTFIAENPPDLWTEKATAFVEWSHDKLMKNENFLSVLTKRGMTLETIKAFKLGYNPTRLFRQCDEWGLARESKENGKPKYIWLPQGTIIPTFEDGKLTKLKIRNANFERELEKYNTERERSDVPKYPPSKYVVVKGSKKCPSIYGNISLDTLLILESELDAILMMQEAGEFCFCLALGGSTQPLDLHKERIVRGVENLLFCPDFDEAGKGSWDRWIKRFPDTKRILTPEGKDPTEALNHGVDLKEWIKGALSLNH